MLRPQTLEQSNTPLLPPLALRAADCLPLAGDTAARSPAFGMLGCEFVAGHLSRASLEFLEVLRLAAQHRLSLLDPLGVSFEALEAFLEPPGVPLRPSWSLLGPRGAPRHPGTALPGTQAPMRAFSIISIHISRPCLID